MFPKKTYETEIGGRKLIVRTGQFAAQANAACTVQYGDTMILATAVMAKEAREGADFFPLMVEYEEKLYSAGKIKGSRFIKREGRPSDEAVITGRVVDRGIRPLFPNGLFNDVQIILSVISYDGESDPDVPAIIAASAVLHISDIPWNGPLGGIRIGMDAEKKWIINPSYAQREVSSLDLVISGTKDKVLMIEAESNEIDEETYYNAFEAAREGLGKVCAFIDDIRKDIGLEKKAISEPASLLGKEEKKEWEEKAKAFLMPKLDEYIFNPDRKLKTERKEDMDGLKKLLAEYLQAQGLEEDKAKEVMGFYYDFLNEQVVKAMLDEDKRVDGRAMDEIRPLSAEVGILPRTHGNGLFSRGQTQVLSVVTLGSPGDEQTLDTLELDGTKRYMHHYNFPPFCVGEAKPIRSTGRREIGHGALAEKALKPVLPPKEEFPYTIRVVSEVLSSNGSSSMGATCGSTLALMDAGVPIKKPVGGIAMGLASDKQGRWKVLTDLQDIEDGDGGMDFKITGTDSGITAVQMDTKTDGLTMEIVKAALSQGKPARMQVLKVITDAIPEPRKELSKYAPRIITFKINPEKIRDVIGPGGKMINEIIDATGVQIDIEDDGSVYITSTDATGAEKAVKWIKDITREPEIGEIFQGKVVKIMDFGAFVEFLPKQEGMVHISELAPYRVNRVEDIVKEGDIIPVKVIKIENGKVGLSLKQADPNFAPPQKPGSSRPFEDRPRGPRHSGPRPPRPPRI